MAPELVIKPEVVVEMVNEMPVEVLVVLAHQCDRWCLSPTEIGDLLEIFPENLFAATKQAIRTDIRLRNAFEVAMGCRLRAARRTVNFVTHPHKMMVIGEDGTVWAYGGPGKSAFGAPDAARTEHARQATLAPIPR